MSKDVIHSVWWTPVARWAPRCDEHWSCDKCHMGLGYGWKHQMEGVDGYELSKVTCPRCKRILKRRRK